MKRKPTDELNELLSNTKPCQLNDYLEKNEAYMADDKKAFYYYMKDVLSEKNIRLKDVYSFAGVSESYGSQILTMEKHTKDRNLIILLCIAGHFNLNETNTALKLYGFTELYAKNSRDACIIVAIHNRIYNLDDIDEMLRQRGLEKLSRDVN